MREQQEVKATGQRENEKGSVENRLFLISVREVISMLAGRRSNEESSILRLQSRFPHHQLWCSWPGDGWMSFQHHQFRVWIGMLVSATG